MGPTDQVARLLVFVAVVADDGTWFDLEVLDAHPLARGELGQFYTF
jgi:hypothetical protein